MVDRSGSRINLKDGQVLILQSSPMGVKLMAQVLSGFGATAFHRCTTAEDARKIAETQTLDLLIVDGQLEEGEGDGYDFVRWLRRSDLQPNAFAPVLVTVAHTSERNVERARDCGANFVITKPVVPTVVWDRILWIARENRPFVRAGDVYVGPDRRFRNLGPPEGVEGRRATDLKGEVSKEAVTPNLSQDQIDNAVRPTKVML